MFRRSAEGQSDRLLWRPAGTVRGKGRDWVVVAMNPKAGRRGCGARVEQLEKQLVGHGLRVTVLDDLDRVTTIAYDLHLDGRLRAVVGVGGDGTACELANRFAAGVPIALMPAGTSNLLARCLRLPWRPAAVAEAVAAGQLGYLDAGRAGGRLFLLMLSCGFDAEVAWQVHHRRQTGRGSGHIGYCSYAKPILATLRRYRYPEIRVEIDSGDRPAAPGRVTSCRWVFALNLPLYGWGLPLAPDASAADGQLDLCTFRGASFWLALWYAAAAQFGGRHRYLKDCSVMPVRRIRITAEEAVRYQLDGDPGGWLPVEVEVAPSRVAFVVRPRRGEAGTGWQASTGWTQPWQTIRRR